MENKDKTIEFCNLAQTQNLLDLELHELRPMLYPRLLHLMETGKLDEQPEEPEGEKRRSLQDLHVDENRENLDDDRASTVRSLLDDRCIVGYVVQRQCQLDKQLLKQIRYRFYKEIRYSGKDYLRKLFDTLLQHSLTTGRTIVIDKNIRLERIGQNTQWKIDFTNYLTQQCRSSYEWLNHLRSGHLRALDLLTLRNYLNQQMIKQRRSEINARLQQEVANRLEKEQQSKHKDAPGGGKRAGVHVRRNKLLTGYHNLESVRIEKMGLEETEMDNAPVGQPEELQQQPASLSEQRVQNVINELSCLQSFKYAHEIFEQRGDLFQLQSHGSLRADLNEPPAVPQNDQQSNEFEAILNRRTQQFELNEIAGILEEERIRNNDDSEEDEMTTTMSNKKGQSKTHGWPTVRRMKRWLRQNAAYGRLRVARFLRRKAFNMRIRYENIKRQHIFVEQLNAPGHLELGPVAPLPANVPYCQTGKSSLIAALKQFNWSHTQGPFVYNQQQL